MIIKKVHFFPFPLIFPICSTANQMLSFQWLLEAIQNLPIDVFWRSLVHLERYAASLPFLSTLSYILIKASSFHFCKLHPTAFNTSSQTQQNTTRVLSMVFNDLSRGAFSFALTGSCEITSIETSGWPQITRLAQLHLVEAKLTHGKQ